MAHAVKYSNTHAGDNRVPGCAFSVQSSSLFRVNFYSQAVVQRQQLDSSSLPCLLTDGLTWAGEVCLRTCYDIHTVRELKDGAFLRPGDHQTHRALEESVG